MNPDVRLNEYYLNGVPHGQMAQALMEADFDLGVFRPFLYNGRSWVTVRNRETGKDETRLVTNTSATLRYDDWRDWDERLIAARKERLGFVSDIVDAGLTYDLDAMRTMVLSYERISDTTGASIVMDPLTRSEKGRPVIDSVDLPIPLVVADFGFGTRYLSVATGNGTPIDTLTGQLKMRRVFETFEDMALGNTAAISYQGKGTVYGLRTYLYRSTKSMTLPTAAGWTPNTFINEVLDMKNTLRTNLSYGPYFMYVSTNWEQYLDRDYSAAYPGVTLRNRLAQINNVSGVRQLDKLSGYQVILVEKTIETVRMVIGMQPRMIQWSSPDGFAREYRIVGSIVPQFFSDQAGNCGICHGTAS